MSILRPRERRHATVSEAHRVLTQAGATVSVAESCTGGLVSCLLTQLPGSSTYFLQGLVVYSNAAKTRLLGIPPSLLKTKGAVSRPVARLMADKVRLLSGSDFGAGITGIAGPSGRTARKPVGSVFIAVSSRTHTSCSVFLFKGTRASIRLQAALACLKMLSSHAKLRSNHSSQSR